MENNEITNVLNLGNTCKGVILLILLCMVQLATAQQQDEDSNTIAVRALVLQKDNVLAWQDSSNSTTIAIFDFYRLIEAEIKLLGSIEQDLYDTSEACPMEAIEGMEAKGAQ